MKLLIKIVIALAVAGVFAYLFVRTAHDARSQPYTVERQHMQTWTLAVEQAGGPSSPLVVVRPPQQLGGGLFGQIFARAGESLRGSTVPAIPLVLRGEYELSLAGRYTPEALVEAARSAGLDSSAFEPRCVAWKRVSQPGLTRQLFYAVFDSPAFVRFREDIGRDAQGAAAAMFNPAALAPIMIVASTDADFDGWLPIGTEAVSDCVAPIEIE